MSVFHKKKPSQYQELQDNFRPAVLPTAGLSLESFATSDYSLNKPEVIHLHYSAVEANTNPVLETTDKHSTGKEGYPFLRKQLDHLKSVHEAEVANHRNQISRIRASREMRIEELENKASILQAAIARLTSEISPLLGLRSQFRLRIGSCTVSIGALVTVAAMVVDALVNYNFLQSFLFSNFLLLWITVACMSVMSDGAMWALGTYLSRRKENFTSKPLFLAICSSLALMFLLSVVASVMIRFGSMDSAYGTINAAGEFVGKSSYSLAEYGVSLVTAFVTTATGILSFCFSLDENAVLVAVREEKQQELERTRDELTAILNELALTKRAEDPAVRDETRRLAAEGQFKALFRGLEYHYSMLAIKKVGDPDFTEKVCASLPDSEPAEKEATESVPDEVALSIEPITFPKPVVNLT